MPVPQKDNRDPEPNSVRSSQENETFLLATINYIIRPIVGFLRSALDHAIGSRSTPKISSKTDKNDTKKLSEEIQGLNLDHPNVANYQMHIPTYLIKAGYGSFKEVLQRLKVRSLDSEFARDVINSHLAYEYYYLVETLLKVILNDTKFRKETIATKKEIARVLFCTSSKGFDKTFFHLIAEPLVKNADDVAKEYRSMLRTTKKFLEYTKINPDEIFKVADEGGNTPIFAIQLLTTADQLQIILEELGDIIPLTELSERKNKLGRSPSEIWNSGVAEFFDAIRSCAESKDNHGFGSLLSHSEHSAFSVYEDPRSNRCRRNDNHHGKIDGLVAGENGNGIVDAPKQLLWREGSSVYYIYWYKFDKFKEALSNKEVDITERKSLRSRDGHDLGMFIMTNEEFAKAEPYLEEGKSYHELLWQEKSIKTGILQKFELMKNELKEPPKTIKATQNLQLKEEEMEKENRGRK